MGMPLDLIWLTVPAYVVLQVVALMRSSGGSRVAAVLPLFVMVPVFALTVVAIVQDSNLWPLWMLFATTLNVSLRWLRRMPAAAVVLGALGGPLAYWGGARLGGMTFAAPLAATVVLAVGWAVLTPAMVWLSRRFDGFPASAPADATAPGQGAFRGTR